jgi:hypothetical protein
VLFWRTPSGELSELDRGGLSWSHRTIRRHASQSGLSSSEPAVRAGADALREKAGMVGDPSLSAPLHDAVARLERNAVDAVGLGAAASDAAAAAAAAAAGADTAGADTAAAASAESDEVLPGLSLRARFGAAAAEEEDGACADGLVELMGAITGGEYGADELVATLTATLEAEPPTDAEMVRLRTVQVRAFTAHTGWRASAVAVDSEMRRGALR